MTKESDRRSNLRGRLQLGLILSGAATLIGLSAGISAAYAASYTYADHLTIDSNQVVDSGVRSVVGGGTAEVAVGVGQVGVTNYYAYPGYRVINEAFVPAGGIARISHPKASNAHSKCTWFISVGGYADITCSVDD